MAQTVPPMITADRVSRWVMYLGVLGLGGSVVQGVAAYFGSFLLAVILVLQYPALQFYRGYTTPKPTIDA